MHLLSEVVPRRSDSEKLKVILNWRLQSLEAFVCFLYFTVNVEFRSVGLHVPAFAYVIESGRCKKLPIHVDLFLKIRAILALSIGSIAESFYA